MLKVTISLLSRIFANSFHHVTLRKLPLVCVIIFAEEWVFIYLTNLRKSLCINASPNLPLKSIHFKFARISGVKKFLNISKSKSNIGNCLLGALVSQFSLYLLHIGQPALHRVVNSIVNCSIS